MSDQKLQGYYDRFSPDKKYEQVLVRSGRAGQASEHNEMQSILGYKAKETFDVLFKDGDIVEGAQVISNSDDVLCEKGKIYCYGAVREVDEAVLAIPMSGTVYVGVYRKERVVTEMEDPNLYNQEVGSPAYGQGGAARLKMWLDWGFKTDTTSDGQEGDFYPVHTLDSGIVRVTETPPTLDSTSRAIREYDTQSTGGYYVCEGMRVRQESDLTGGEQCYTVAEGSARVGGYSIKLTTSRRLPYAAVPDYLIIESEPHSATGKAGQVITPHRTPLDSIQKIKVLQEKTVTMSHGAYAGCSDLLPDNSVLRILEVKQGNIIYNQGTDYYLNAGQIAWEPTGSGTQEPATGSSYQVTYQYNNIIACDAWSEESITVSGAVANSEIEVSYTAKLPRIDKLCLSSEGEFIFIQGVASDSRPIPPRVPENMLGLASIYQSWDSERKTVTDAVMTVPMNELASINDTLWELKTDMARLALISDINTREDAKKYGIFTDSFLDDSQRDQGTKQSGAIVNNTLTLPIDVSVTTLTGIKTRVALPYTLVPCLEQLLRTGSMLVNPYAAFDPIPAIVKLDPAIDRWTETQTEWNSTVTNRVTNTQWLTGVTNNIVSGWGSVSNSSSSTTTESSSSSSSNTVTNIVSKTKSEIEYLRSITVKYTIDGFAPNEKLASLTFDGISLAVSTTDKTDSDGIYTGSFKIPEGVSSGAKEVIFKGSGTSRAMAVFVGQGMLNVTTLQNVTTITTTNTFQDITTVSTYRYDPLAQTFSLEADTTLGAVDLWFTAKGTKPVTVQIRETTAGMPNQVVLTSKRLAVSSIKTNGTATRAVFDFPLYLSKGAEYALIVLTDDNKTACSIAEVGKSTLDGLWVTSQPYTIGVLLSSSNASTWTPHQNRDLTFRLLKAEYSKTSMDVVVGKIAASKMSDLVLLGLVDRPNAKTRVEFALTYTEQNMKKSLLLSEEQPLQFATPLSGDCSITAKLIGNANASPVVYNGAQALIGEIGTSGDYVSTVIDAGTTSTTIKIILAAYIPAGASMQVYVAKALGTFILLSNPVSVPLGNGWQEMTWTKENYSEETVRCKIVLKGSSKSRPMVENLRMIAMD